MTTPQPPNQAKLKRDRTSSLEGQPVDASARRVRPRWGQEESPSRATQSYESGAQVATSTQRESAENVASGSSHSATTGSSLNLSQPESLYGDIINSTRRHITEATSDCDDDLSFSDSDDTDTVTIVTDESSSNQQGETESTLSSASEDSVDTSPTGYQQTELASSQSHSAALTVGSVEETIPNTPQQAATSQAQESSFEESDQTEDLYESDSSEEDGLIFGEDSDRDVGDDDYDEVTDDIDYGREPESDANASDGTHDVEDVEDNSIEGEETSDDDNELDDSSSSLDSDSGTHNESNYDHSEDGDLDTADSDLSGISDQSDILDDGAGGGHDTNEDDGYEADRDDNGSGT